MRDLALQDAVLEALADVDLTHLGVDLEAETIIDVVAVVLARP